MGTPYGPANVTGMTGLKIVDWNPAITGFGMVTTRWNYGGARAYPIDAHGQPIPAADGSPLYWNAAGALVPVAQILAEPYPRPGDAIQQGGPGISDTLTTKQGGVFSGPPFLTPASLRAYYGWNMSYPPGQISRIPDGADWLPNITGIGGQGQIQGFVGPIITTPGVAANGGQGYAFDANKNMLFWDATGHLVAQNELPASSGAAQWATSLADAYNPAGPHFGDNIQVNGGTTQFEPSEAVSIAGRMANLGEDLATATARASASATKLGLKVTQQPAATVTAPVVQSYATPPGAVLPKEPIGPVLTLPSLNADRAPATPTRADGVLAVDITPALPATAPTLATAATPAAATPAAGRSRSLLWAIIAAIIAAIVVL